MTRCDHWLDGLRCTREGEGYLVSPDGKRVPGGPVCRECADATIAEYAEKLGGVWTFEPVAARLPRPAGEASEHPTDEQLGALIEGRLVGNEREQVIAHCSECQSCRELVGKSINLADELEQQP